MRICAHSVAIAEMCKKLPEFVEKLRKSKESPISAISHKPQCQKGEEEKEVSAIIKEKHQQ